jgi:hypothetical protein
MADVTKRSMADAVILAVATPDWQMVACCPTSQTGESIMLDLKSKFAGYRIVATLG